MRKIVIILLLTHVFNVNAQINEVFNAPSIMELPAWNGSNQTRDFIIIDGQLRSDSRTLNSSFYISTPSTLALSCSWAFTVNLKFNTSGANYVDVYLVADKPDLKSTVLNGYFLRIGGTDDELALYRRSGSLSNAVKLTDGLNGVTNSTNTHLNVRITRDASGQFSVEREVVGGLSGFLVDGVATDLAYTNSGWFGLYVQQSTATFIQKHFFDNILVSTLYDDSERPTVKLVTAISEQSLRITFSEAVDVASALDPLNYVLDPAQIGTLAVEPTGDASIYLLNLATPLRSGRYALNINNISDMFGNLLLPNTQSQFYYVRPYVATKGALVFNELMVDPSPTVGLPDGEYIELWNRTTETILLKSWRLTVGSATHIFGADTIFPSQHLLLAKAEDVDRFRIFGAVLGLAKWAVLANDAGALRLTDPEGTEIDAMEYTIHSYRDLSKRNGGYSLELVDPGNRCRGAQNWRATIHEQGGTPGVVNSVFKSQFDQPVVSLTDVSVVDSTTIIVAFSGDVDLLTLYDPTNYQVNNGAGKPISITAHSSDHNKATLVFEKPFLPGIEHILSVGGLYTCAGTGIVDTEGRGRFLWARSVKKGDLIINEVMFNPKTGGADFIELLNTTADILDMSKLQVANEGPGGAVGTVRTISLVQLLIKPGGFAVLTVNVAAQSAHYFLPDPGNLHYVELPSFALASGSVLLMQGTEVLDHLKYTEKMHAPLLAIVKGVSLERRSKFVQTNAPGAFMSASATAGYATPGYRNSVSTDDVVLTEPIRLNGRLFSPDGDGKDDLLDIFYQFADGGKMGSMKVFDDKGRLQRVLINNALLGSTGVVSWDGNDMVGKPCAVGIYLIVFEVFDLTGKRQRFVKDVVLGRK